jgi:hypothetical protein
VLLANALPELALELERLLAKAGKPELAAQIAGLVILDRCRCGDDFCSSFYTQPEPEGPYGPGHDCMDLDADEGMVLLDVVTGTIVHVEILNRDDIRRKLIAQLP